MRLVAARHVMQVRRHRQAQRSPVGSPARCRTRRAVPPRRQQPRHPGPRRHLRPEQDHRRPRRRPRRRHRGHDRLSTTTTTRAPRPRRQPADGAFLIQDHAHRLRRRHGHPARRLTHAIVTDLIGTPTELLAPDGTLAWHARATLWGVTAPPSPDEPTCLLRFPGQYHDPESGLNYNYHRHYDPTTAHYESPDPLGLAPAPNPVGYISNPLKDFDPLGLAPCSLADEARSLLGNPDDVVVLGRIPDTAIARGWAGHVVLNTPNWSIKLNDAFIREAIDQGRRMYLASPLKDNLIQIIGPLAGKPTVYAREIEMLLDAGYRKVGDYMVPPR